MNRLRTSLGLERNIVVMLAGIIIIGIGEELWTRFIPRYLELLGATAWLIAWYGTLRDFLDAVYQYPGGWLADRLGRRGVVGRVAHMSLTGLTVCRRGTVSRVWPSRRACNSRRALASRLMTVPIGVWVTSAASL